MPDGSRLTSDQRPRWRRFVAIMIVHLVGFGLVALSWFVWHIPWLAVTFLAATLPLHWMAMLVADAYPAARSRRRKVRRTK
jgi:Protein of unknown function (DUF3099)